jgi:hypothetical protein
MDIYQEDGIQVRLMSESDASGQVIPKDFQHPWNVDIRTLSALLRSVDYRKGAMVFRREALLEAFPTAKRRALLKPIQTAFAQAGPEQAVEFSFIHEGTSLKIFRREYLTDGLLFRKGGRFHVAFRNLAFEMLAPEDGDGYAPNRENPTRGPSRTQWTLVPREGQALAKNEDKGLLGPKTFSNWIEIDLSRPWADDQTAAVEEEKERGGVYEQGETETPISEGLGQPPRVDREEVEERMQFLDELYQDGTLSRNAYEEKKRALQELYESLPAAQNP